MKINNAVKSIVLIVSTLAIVCFYESKRIETLSSATKTPLIRSLGLLYASGSESLKLKLGISGFFDVDKAFWQKIKEPPKILDYPVKTAAVPTSPITPAPSPTNTVLPTKIESPFSILLVGDSFVAEGFGPGLEKELLLYKDTSVYRKGIYSTGLSRPDYFNWNDNIKKLIAEQNPNIVVVMFGANDAQDIKTLEGKTASHYGDKNWSEEYAKNVAAFLEILIESRLTVFWIGNPIARDDYYVKKMQTLNSVFGTTCRQYADCNFISTWLVLADSQGKYSAYLPDETGKNRLARASDGIHPTRFGAETMIRFVLDKIKEKINLELKPLPQ